MIEHGGKRTQGGSLFFGPVRPDGLDPLVQAITRHTHALGYFGDGIAAIDNLTDGLVLELEG